MHDYEPLDLTAWCNADATLLGTSQTPARGPQSFHGLPFQIGDPDSASNACFVAFGPNGHTGSLRIPVGRTAHRLIVAHRLLDSSLYPVRRSAHRWPNMPSSWRTASASPRRSASVSRSWRCRFPGAGTRSTRSTTSRTGSPRHSGPWDHAGRRQTEVTQSHPRDYVLWT
ncbi:MAG: hypothetical protein U0841_22510 [Chloroflexia bacterium]